MEPFHRFRSRRTLVLPQFVDALDDLASQTCSLRLSDAQDGFVEELRVAHRWLDKFLSDPTQSIE